MQQLIDSKDNGLIKIVTGLRRVGKSYLLKTLFKEYLLDEGKAKSHHKDSRPLPESLVER